MRSCWPKGRRSPLRKRPQRRQEHRFQPDGPRSRVFSWGRPPSLMKTQSATAHGENRTANENSLNPWQRTEAARPRSEAARRTTQRRSRRRRSRLVGRSREAARRQRRIFGGRLIAASAARGSRPRPFKRSSFRPQRPERAPGLSASEPRSCRWREARPRKTPKGDPSSWDVGNGCAQKAARRAMKIKQTRPRGELRCSQRRRSSGRR